MNRFATFLFVGSCAILGGTAAVTVPPLLVMPATAQQGTTLGAPTAAEPVIALGDRFEAIAKQVLPAVVSVEAVKPPKVVPGSTAKAKPVEESGSGVIVQLPHHKGHLVLTNNHVVSQALPEKITIHLADGRIFKANRVWTDPESDVALIGLDAPGSLPTVPLGDSDQTKIGQWVLAFGSPFGLNQTVTHGILSARDRGQVSLGSTIRIKDFLQTDAAINPGSSGGPLVDMKGTVIGINTAIASHSGSNSGVAFSIPINLAKRVGKELLEKGAVSRGYLGLQVAGQFEPADAFKLGLDRVQGAWVERVYEGTPAAAAGLKANDVVLQVDTITIRNENHLINLISAMAPGQRIQMRVWRDRKTITLEGTVGDWAKAQNRVGP
ncbi:MAG TPA: trypsin-like peptidase domain-containing protein [Gemmataceae bacterium]|nr:trypsin-like peptidase domain-containing protein [Gemmataceae bacterium]